MKIKGKNLRRGRGKVVEAGKMVNHNCSFGFPDKRLHFLTNYVNGCNRIYDILWFSTAQTAIFRQIVYIKFQT